MSTKANFGKRPSRFAVPCSSGENEPITNKVCSETKRKEEQMNSKHWVAGLSTLLVAIGGCATAPAPGSKDEAVNNAWDRFCKSGYCEGYPASIVGRSESTLTVSINGNTRYLTYIVSGEPGKYVAVVNTTADHGRTKP